MGATIMEKLKGRRKSDDLGLNGETLYKALKGRTKGNDDSAIYTALAKVDMDGIRLHKKDKAMGGQRNVIFGIMQKRRGEPQGRESEASSSTAPPSPSGQRSPTPA